MKRFRELESTVSYVFFAEQPWRVQMSLLTPSYFFLNGPTAPQVPDASGGGNEVQKLEVELRKKIEEKMETANKSEFLPLYFLSSTARF